MLEGPTFVIILQDSSAVISLQNKTKRERFGLVLPVLPERKFKVIQNGTQLLALLEAISMPPPCCWLYWRL